MLYKPAKTTRIEAPGIETKILFCRARPGAQKIFLLIVVISSKIIKNGWYLLLIFAIKTSIDIALIKTFCN